MEIIYQCLIWADMAYLEEKLLNQNVVVNINIKNKKK